MEVLNTFQYLNLHPQGKRVGDCVKRAIAGATGKDYKQVALELNRLKKVTGCAKFNDDRNWQRYLQDFGCLKISFPAEKGRPRMNGHTFCEEFCTGTYILRMAGHLTFCKDGVIYDTWDCRSKCVYAAYKL